MSSTNNNKRRTTSLAEKEAKRFANHHSTYPPRSRSLQPTLEELKSLSFTEYVQYALFHDDEEDESDGEIDSESNEENDDSTTERKQTEPNQPKPSSVFKVDKDKVEWNHGIVKITLPDGLWDESGIEKDRTARGPAWQKGTKLGDMMVRGPIKQHVNGIGGIYEYALLDHPALTLSEYREKADAHRKSQVGNVGENEDYSSDEVCDALARKFWRRLGPTTPPSVYGADMEGSLFGGDWCSGWSLEELDNCLQLLQGNDSMPGVTTPYLYVGMWGSVFCAHTEDLNLLSINYLHAGAPKYWYAIAPHHAKRFESLAESHFAHASSKCKEFLRHKEHLMSPAILKKAGVEFEIQVQRPGDAIITCPGAYHFGVNLGFNVAEATNFAIPEWVPIGRVAKVCMCRPHSVRMNVDRFASLLSKYSADAETARQLGFPRLDYRRWILLESSRSSKRKKEEEEELLQEQQKEAQQQNPTQGTSLDVFTSEAGQTYTIVSSTSRSDAAAGKEFWVEVMKPLNENGKSLSLPSTSKRRKKKKQKKGTDEAEEWRLAKPLSNSKKTAGKVALETKVLCLLPGKAVVSSSSKGDVEVEDEQCFAGVVTELVDGHCRVHFAGLKKEDDVWMKLDSPKLFLDGGKWEDETQKSKQQKSNNKKKKLNGTKTSKSGQ